MDVEGRFGGVRKWDFSGQHASAEQAPEASQHQPTFLETSACRDRSSTVTESNSKMNYAWMPRRNFLSATKSTTVPIKSNQEALEIGGVATVQPSPENPQSNEQFETTQTKVGEKHPSGGKRTEQVATETLTQNKPRKQPSVPKKKKSGSASIGKREKRNPDVVADGVAFDFSGVPAPVCSCTGVARQCYRWGAGGWQSSCCTTTISEYPLPLSTSRPGSRLAGRKMSNGAYGKLLQRLAIEGHDLSMAIDLKSHWARHGTNKFVIIK